MTCLPRIHELNIEIRVFVASFIKLTFKRFGLGVIVSLNDNSARDVIIIQIQLISFCIYKIQFNFQVMYFFASEPLVGWFYLF